jgi:hypothetical protein
MNHLNGDQPVYISASIAVTSLVIPRLAEITAIAELCSYILASVASALTIALAVNRWHQKRHRYDGSDNENL